MLTCQEYIFKLTSGQLEEAQPIDKLWAFQHRMVCRKCRNFTTNDALLGGILHHYKQRVTAPDDQPKE